MEDTTSAAAVSTASLRNQLNEANSRWRREEKRAKAREEELELQLQTERNRCSELVNELEQAKLENDQVKEKLRESTRKRQQVQAQAQLSASELEALRPYKVECEQLRKALEECKTELDGLNQANRDALAGAQAKQAELVKLVAEKTSLQQEMDQLKLEREELVKVRAELVASEERAESMQITIKHNARLVKDLKSELARAIKQSEAAPPPPPVPVPAPMDNKLVKDLASRLEALLKENATLGERVRFLEEIIHDMNQANKS